MPFLEIIVVVGNILIISGVFPQIYTQIKTKTRKGLNPGMMFLWAVGNLLLVIYNYLVVHDWYVLSLFFLNFSTSVFMLYLYYFRSE